MNWTQLFTATDDESGHFTISKPADGAGDALLMGQPGPQGDIMTRADVARMHVALGEWLAATDAGTTSASDAAVATARDRAREAVTVGANPQTAAWFALERALDDVDGTLREATDAELAAVTRALIGDLQ